MPIERVAWDLVCDVCGGIGPAVEIAEPHDEGGEEPYNTVQVCEGCLAKAILDLDDTIGGAE